MKILHISKGKETDITQLIDGVKWSGDYQQVARRLSFGVLYSPTDKNVPKTNIELGDMIKMLGDGNRELFRGYVFTKDRQLSSNTIEFDVYDGLIYLTKSTGTYNFKSATPAAITKRIANDFNIKLGTMPTGSPIKRIFSGENLYDIIMTAYTFESNKTGKKYMPNMRRGKLNIIEKGSYTTTFLLDSKVNITDASFTEDLENSINVVKVYDDNDNYKGEVKLDGVPGRLQDVYKGDGGKSEARALLEGIGREASIDALGDFECLTGNAVMVKEPHTGLVGKFFIDTDEHTFEDGKHRMKLGLSFDNIMDEATSGDDPDEVKEEEQQSGGGTPRQQSAGGGGSKVDDFTSAAESMRGYRYSQANRMGSNSADCSSLVGRAMKKAGLTNNAQLTTRSIVNDSRFKRVGKGNLQKGDILWERGHVAIYMGGNRTLEARHSVQRVDYANLGNRFTTAYRIKGL